MFLRKGVRKKGGRLRIPYAREDVVLCAVAHRHMSSWTSAKEESVC